MGEVKRGQRQAGPGEQIKRSWQLMAQAEQLCARTTTVVDVSYELRAILLQRLKEQRQR